MKLPIIILIVAVLSFGCSKAETKVTGQTFLNAPYGKTVKVSNMPVAIHRAEEIKQLMLDNQAEVLQRFAAIDAAHDSSYPTATDIAVGELSDFLFSNALSPVARATTDGDGNFTVKIKEPGVYVLAARNSPITHVWLYTFTAQGGETRVILSNTNATTTWLFPERLKTENINLLFTFGQSADR